MQCRIEYSCTMEISFMRNFFTCVTAVLRGIRRNVGDSINIAYIPTRRGVGKPYQKTQHQ